MINWNTLKRILLILIFIYYGLSCTRSTDLFSESVSDLSPERFYIKLDEDFFIRDQKAVPKYELSSNDQIGLIDCGINKGQESFEDIYCTLDLNEADIGVLGQSEMGIPIQYNVPRGMCEYTSFMAPWHWNQRSGVAAKYVDECTYTPTENGGGQEEIKWFRIKEGPSVDSTILVHWMKVDDDKEEICFLYRDSNIPSVYDRSKSGAANCCFGTSRVTPYTTDIPNPSGCSPGSSSDSNGQNSKNRIAPEDKTWSGVMKSCIGGPLRSGGDYATAKKEISKQRGYAGKPCTATYKPFELEYPIPTVTYTQTQGLRETFEVGPVTQGTILGWSTPSVNYFKGIEDMPFTDYNTCSDCPGIFFPDSQRRNGTVDDQSGCFPIGYPYFTLTCLDSNFETLHRVHLIIREWNTQEEFLSFQDSDGRSGDPDVTGVEGKDCPYYEPDEFLNHSKSQCNDFLDLDDVINGISVDPPYPRARYEGS